MNFFSQGVLGMPCFWLLLFMLFSKSATSQVGVLPLLENETKYDSLKPGVYFDLEAVSFLKNNEYNSQLTRGFTGIGYFAKPALHYESAVHRYSITAGSFLRFYSGQNKFNQVLPILRIQAPLSSQIELVMGTIYGNLNHGLEEALFRFDRFYNDHLENGFQVFWNNALIESEFWLNWDVFIEEDDPFQERFHFGSVSKIQILDKQIKLSLVLQHLLTHTGGEIDSSPAFAYTILNGVAGAHISIPSKGNYQWLIEPLFFTYNNLSSHPDEQRLPNFGEGQALYIKAAYEGKGLSGLIAYWHSENFWAPLGESLFHNVSDYSDYTVAQRNLLNAKLTWTALQINGLDIQFRFDLYYDIDENSISHAAGFYMRVNEQFWILDNKP